MDLEQDDKMYRRYVMQSVERGLADAAAGRVTPHAQVAAKLRQKWQRKTTEQKG
jgi:predicted transcriptional regulator